MTHCMCGCDHWWSITQMPRSRLKAPLSLLTRICLTLGLCKGLSVASGKQCKFPPVTWAHNPLRLIQSQTTSRPVNPEREAMSHTTLTALLSPGPLFTKRQDVLPPNLAMSRSRVIGCCNNRIALKFDRHLGSGAAEVPVKFQSDWKSSSVNLVASRLCEILR